MTDKELLELAAKAFDLPECGWMGPAFMYVKDNTFTEWNPLTDDGDALRLAVKLDINVYVQLVSGFTMASAEPEIDEVEPHGNDRYAATRRAITRTAAEIGKTLKK